MWVAVGVAVVAVALLYLAATRGVAAWDQARTPDDAGPGALPVVVENAPPGIGTTEQHGPLGAVSMVFAGTDVEDGLIGEVEHPWIAIGARSGDYRAIAAPDLPASQPHALAVSPAGDRIAWATGDGLRVYDVEQDSTRSVTLADATRVGAFSPDGARLTVHAGGLRVLELTDGEVVAGVDGTAPAVVGNAAWRPDGSAVDYVAGRQLMTVAADGSGTTRQPSPFAPGASLLWAADGRRLIGMQKDASGSRRLFSASVAGDGTVGPIRRVDTAGLALVGLLGVSGESSVAVRAYLLQTGNIERILEVPLDSGGPVDDLTTLPWGGRNWRGGSTMAVAAEALESGSTDFGNPVWPWRYRARLAACVLAGVFVLGLWATRTRRSRR